MPSFFKVSRKPRAYFAAPLFNDMERSFNANVEALLSPFVETFREMREMRYLWKRPVKLDNSKLVAFLGHEPHTPLDIAVRATLAGLDCIDTEAAPASLPADASLTKGTI